MFPSTKSLLILFISAFTFFSCANTNKAINETAKSPHIQVQGKVSDAETGEAIKGIGVWVEGTTITSYTDERGEYTFMVPLGYYEVHVERKGFSDQVKELVLEAGARSINDFNFELEIKPGMGNFESPDQSGFFDDTLDREIIQSEMEEAEKAEESNLQLQEFIDHYINDDLKCELLNKEDITFTESDEGVMNVNGPVELAILNHELGYKVKVLLEDYISKEYGEILGLNVEADYFFEEMKPKNEKDAQRWGNNRQKYFDGSLRHFLIAMASDKSPLYFGYRLYSGQFVSSTSAMAYTATNVSDIEVEKEVFLKPPNVNGAWSLEFDDELRVEYVKKGIDDPDRIMGLKDYKYQTSWLSLISASVQFSKNGTVKNPDYLEKKGVWRYTPVCKMLPTDYLPEN